MSPIIVENIVMANIIVTPERKKENITKTVKTRILGQKPVSWIASIHTYGWKIQVGLKKGEKMT